MLERNTAVLQGNTVVLRRNMAVLQGKMAVLHRNTAVLQNSSSIEIRAVLGYGQCCVGQLLYCATYIIIRAKSFVV